MHRLTPLLIALTLAACAGESPHEPRQADSPATHAEQVFAKYDTDKSGTITKAEATDPLLAQHFDGIDLDANGEIDIHEMTEAASKVHDAHHEAGDEDAVNYKEAAVEAHVAEVMATYDSDKNGELSKAEVAGQPFAEHFDTLDDDSSGGITAEELTNHIKAAHDHP